MLHSLLEEHSELLVQQKCHLKTPTRKIRKSEAYFCVIKCKDMQNNGGKEVNLCLFKCSKYKIIDNAADNYKFRSEMC